NIPTSGATCMSAWLPGASRWRRRFRRPTSTGNRHRLF
ncbi:uncharacterized protein METZ01_LOCUS488285, partial [marine metagenome]